MKQNEQQLNLKVLKKRDDEFEQFEQILLVIFLSSVKLVHFNQFFFLLCIQAVFSVGHTKPYIEKLHWIDAKLAGHVHKLDVELQNLCGSDFSLFVVRILAKPYSELTNNTLRKQRWCIFLYHQIRMP